MTNNPRPSERIPYERALTSGFCLLPLLFVLSSCGTSMSRTTEYAESGWQPLPYSGVQRDLVGLIFGRYDTRILAGGAQDADEPPSAWIPVFAALDLPLSFLLDTLLLPVDLVSVMTSTPPD